LRKMATPTMWAVVRGSNGLTWEAAHPLPQLKPDHVLLRVRAAALNPVDYKAPKALLGPVAGFDVAGVVEGVGAGCTTWRQGDEVFGRAHGSLAQFALAPSNWLARKPASLSWAEASAYGVAHLTSMQVLRDHAGMKQGDRVLIIGASGGTGLAGLQLAKALGASEIVAVCSGASAELCRQQGADRIVDYTTDLAGGRTLEDVLGAHSFDVVYDCATGSGGGEDYKTQGLAVMKREHTMVAINGGCWDWLKSLAGCCIRQHKLMITSGQGNTQDLEFFVKAGIKPVMAPGYEATPMTEENVMKGFGLLKSRRAKGKIAFVVNE